MPKLSIAEEYKDKLDEVAAISKIVGTNLHRLRSSAKNSDGKEVSLPWLAKLTALGHNSLWRFENGKSGMTVATLVRLRKALKCSADDLLDGCDSEIVKERERLMGEVRREK